MTFFNPQKDILEVRLTTYGVQLYSAGKFKPEIFITTDCGVLYEDFELAADFREYLRENFAILRSQREDTGFDTGIQNFDYLFDSLSPYSIGSTLETVVEDESRTMVPNINLAFGSGLVASATKDSNVINVVLDDVVSLFSKTVIPNESILADNIFEREANQFYQFSEDYLFVDVSEQGAEFTKENFWLLVYEKYGAEYRQVDLEERYLNEFGLVDSKVDITAEIDVKVDNKIDDMYMCKHAQKINDNNNIYITNKGTINVDLMGKMCKDNLTSQKFPKVYINRKEKDLGDQC